MDQSFPMLPLEESDSSKNRGYVLLWRAFWDDPDIHDHGPWPERMAWLYLFSNLANGIEKNGIPRGEFLASERFLANKWQWSRSKVHRFIEMLEKTGKIKRVNRNPISVNHLADQLTNHFIICKYELYQKQWTSNRTSNRTKSKEGIKESINTKPPTPFSDTDLVVQKWNLCAGVKPIRKLDRQRKIHLEARLSETDWPWQEALSKFPLPCFKEGGWIPNFDWFIRPGTADKILEGKYDWSKKPDAVPMAVRLADEEDKRNYNPHARD